MKKFFAFFFAGLICFFVFVPSVKAEETPVLVEITAPSAVLIEESTGDVLFEKNAHELRPCASITKVMTLVLTFEAISSGKLSFDQYLTASAHAASMGGSDIWLKEGEAMTVDDLIKAVVIMSANDAAVVLAEAISGSEDAFIAEMNRKGEALGMTNTVFKNCNGLDEEGHLTTAYDVSLMSRELLKYDKIQDYTLTWIDYIRDGATQLVNTNKLIRSYDGIKGLKTGTTSGAGSCVSAAAERSGMGLIAVVLGAASSDERFSDAAAVLNYGFANYAILSPEVPEIGELEVKGGMEKTVKTTVIGESSILTQIGDKEIEVKTEINEEITAPITKGQTLGTIGVYKEGEKLKELQITTTDDVAPITFFAVISRILEIYFL